ncbi:hypothetical protein O0L34_g8608 [Tuta absoluta]|nr:hypothetical protein O0L34_g8608 [Tuta absoluta]
MAYTVLLWLFGLWTTDVRATTHWLVTETGLIQPRVDSPFEMARPYDLLAFLNQDTRWDNIRKLYNELSTRQIDINKLWAELEFDTDINTWLSKDKNCKKTGPLNYLDWYATRLEDGLTKHIPQEDFQLYDPSYGEDVDVPDCKKISSLTFSMFAFEHLEAMVNRENLSIHAELSLPELIAPVMTVEQFGHWVATVLRRNSSSWLHYNMASLYWRVRGNAPKALECSRRAVHYAPREYKDIALLSMGTVLHRARRPEDAIIVLGAAVDHDPQSTEAHFVLAHAYAVLGEFNSSVNHYEETLKLDSGYDQAVKNRFGVFCVKELIRKMRGIHKKLLKLKSELIEYAGKEALWLKSQAAFLRTMKHNEDFDFRNIEKIVTKMSEITGLNIKDLKKEGDKNSLIQYFLDGRLYNEKWFAEKDLLAVEAAFSVHRLIKHIGKHADMAADFVIQPHLVQLSDEKIKQEIGPVPLMPLLAKIAEDSNTESQSSDKPSSKPDDDTYELEMGLPLYPSSMKVSRSMEDFDRDPDWPSDRLCKEKPANADFNIEAVYPVFLPFENKGLRLKGLLTDRIGVGVHTEHELPWHPPMCPSAKEAALIQKRAHKQQLLPEIAVTDHLHQKLLEYVGDGYPDQVTHMQDAEIGQRIYTAMQSNVAPKWVVYTLASLYWRVRGKTDSALSCLLAASKNVKVKYKDVVLTSLASVYLEMGYFEEALLAAEEAYKLGPYEPAVNFLLYQMNMIKKQRNSQMFHLKQALRVEPRYLHGTARRLLTAWACMLKQVNMIKKQRNSQMFHLKQALRVEPRYLHGTARRLLTAWACMLKQVNALQGFGESSSSSTVTYHSLTYSASERHKRHYTR